MQYEDFAPAPPIGEEQTEEPQPQQDDRPQTVLPQQVTSYGTRTDAAVGLVWGGLGAIAGAYVLGPLGALAGVIASGAVRNGVRAAQNWKSLSENDRQEATKSATMAVFGTGVAGMLAYAAASKKEE